MMRRLWLWLTYWKVACVCCDGGPAPWLAEYGLAECADHGYPARTRANVRDSDATVRIALNFMSAGELCTLRAISTFAKPSYDVPMRRVSAGNYALAWSDVDMEMFRAFLRAHNVRVLNVAGNAERTALGIGAAAEAFLMAALA